MGVTGLWQILESVGHPIKLDGLEGKRLGVDANIWLYKFVRGFREKDNAPIQEGHKLGLYIRICKLLFYKIKPVFVFDGPAPALKRRTIEKRLEQRDKQTRKAQNPMAKLISDQIKDQIDIFSEAFKKLPVEVRYEILVELRDSNKKIKSKAMPDDAGAFSGMQMERLRGRRLVQSMIEACEKEMDSGFSQERVIRVQSDPSSTMVYRNNADYFNPQANSTSSVKTITSRVIEEAKELLRLFGIPYVDAAGEAEAQCATLEKLGLTEGTITDDSDIWLFGAKNVFRYFFSDDKYAMQYKMADIEFHLNLKREDLICFAMMVGSDYTDGIMNVGAVTALEILGEFSGEGIDRLVRFKEWKENYSAEEGVVGNKKRESFLKFDIPGDFPDERVFEGYMQPAADRSDESFVWGTPDYDELHEYARRNFAWDRKKSEEKLNPVMEKLGQRGLQRRIDTFFFKTQANRNPEMFRSKRVNTALEKLANKKVKIPEVIEVDLSEDSDD